VGLETAPSPPLTTGLTVPAKPLYFISFCIFHAHTNMHTYAHTYKALPLTNPMGKIIPSFCSPPNCFPWALTKCKRHWLNMKFMQRHRYGFH